MSDNSKTKKIDKELPLTNSQINEYGFRLLTSGYQLHEFKRNPIGYYMHIREKGVICRWEDFRIDGDTVYAKPVINLANPLGEQTVSEIENGFLSHASVGMIVLLEHIVEPHPDDPNKSIITGTKWYNKECSPVDAPGNRSLLPVLLDANDNVINLSDLTSKIQIKMDQVQLPITADLMQKIGLADNSKPNAAAITEGINNLATKVVNLEAENQKLKIEKQAAEKQAADLTKETLGKQVNDLLDQAVNDGKINVKVRARLAAEYENRPADLKDVIEDMDARALITPNLKQGEQVSDEFAGKTWDELYEADKIPDLKSKNPDLFKQLYKDKFKKEPLA